MHPTIQRLRDAVNRHDPEGTAALSACVPYLVPRPSAEAVRQPSTPRT